MSIRLKLLAGCLSLTLVMIAMGGFALFSQREVGKLAERIYDKALLSMSYLRSAQNTLVVLEAEVRDIETNPERTAVAQARGARQVLKATVPDILADVEVAAERAISPAGKRKMSEIRTELIRLGADEGGPAEANILGALTALDDQFDIAVEIFAGDGYRFRKEVGGLVDQTIEQSLLAIVGGVAIAFLISLLLARMIVPPLNKAVGFAKHIAAGKLDNEIVPKGRSETADLLRALATMQAGISGQLDRIRQLMDAQADRYDNQIALQNSRFEAALHNMSQGLCMFDENHKLVVFNRRFAQMFGGIRLGVAAPEVLIDHEIQHLLSPGRDAFFTHELPDGRVISVTRQKIESGGWVDTFEDITVRRRAERELSHLAMHDALTDLANRVRFREHLEETLSRTRGRATTAVLCLDLDGFKSVNDTLGHPVGDELLKAVASKLSDCVDGGALVARLGGDEFAIVLTAEDPATAAQTMAQRIIDILGAPFDLEAGEVSIGVSIGIVLPQSDSEELEDADKLLKNADLALYRAKADGRSTYRFFQREMDERIQARRQMELDLRFAIERGQLELYYQPFVDTNKGSVSGFEALLRWRHPDRGMVSPGEFVPLAEETGLIRTIGAWVIKEACRQAAGWPEELSVSVNLSPVQFRSDTLVDDVRRTLEETGLQPGRLQLEVTESLLLQDSTDILAVLTQFRALGIQISMDDFGTGYSSLGYISRFPFDKIKIDQSFVRGIERADNLAIIRAVVGLSRALNMGVIAEGVETSNQRDTLKREGCIEMQGYYFSKPQPVGELARVMLDIGMRQMGARSCIDPDFALISDLPKARQRA